MDYLYFKYKNKDPFYFLKMSKEQRTVARAYMLKFIDEKNEERNELEEILRTIQT